MNLFCRLLGHTWIDRFENPKIRWTAAKNMSEMEMQSDGDPETWRECVRCKARSEAPTAEPRAS